MDTMLDNIKASVYSGKQNLVSGLDQDNEKKVRLIVEKDFATLKPHMLGFMIQRGSSTKLNHAMQWLSTPLGSKIAEMKLFPLILYTDPEAPIPINEADTSKEREKFKNKFKNQLFTPMASITELTLAHHMTLENHTKAPNQRLPKEKLAEQIKIAKVRIRGIVQQIIPHTFDRNFSGLSLEELTVSMNFLSSEAGKAYIDLIVDAYAYAITQTEPAALLSLSKLYENELSILSPYSKTKITQAKARELMAMLIKQHGKATVIRAMVEARNGQMTIIKNGEESEVFGRPSHTLVTLDTLMKDLDQSGKDIRKFYIIVQKKLRK